MTTNNRYLQMTNSNQQRNSVVVAFSSSKTTSNRFYETTTAEDRWPKQPGPTNNGSTQQRLARNNTNKTIIVNFDKHNAWFFCVLTFVSSWSVSQSIQTRRHSYFVGQPQRSTPNQIEQTSWIVHRDLLNFFHPSVSRLFFPLPDLILTPETDSCFTAAFSCPFV